MNRFLSKLIVCLFLSLVPSRAWAAYSFIAHTEGQSQAGTPLTVSATCSGACSMVGSDLLIMVLTGSAASDPPSISDDSSNSWNNCAVVSTIQRLVKICYVQNPTVDSNMTFTATVIGSGFMGMSVLGFSGSVASPVDQTDSNTAMTVTSLHPASPALTPLQDNELIIAGLAFATQTITAVSGYDATFQLAGVGGQATGVAVAYLIQTSAASTDPIFSWTGNDDVDGAIASFKAAAAGGGSAGRLLLLGVGK